MSIRRAILTSALTLTALAFSAIPAGAHATRELLGTFGSMEVPGSGGIAVDLETGNVYVADNHAEAVDIYGANGGAPTGGAPTRITGFNLRNLESQGFNPVGIAVDNSCYEHEPRLTGSACEEYDPSYGDVYIGTLSTSEPPSVDWAPNSIRKFKLNPGHGYELASRIYLPSPAYATPDIEAHERAARPLGVAVDSHGNLYSVSNFLLPVIEFKKTVEKIVNSGKEEVQENLEEISLPQAGISERGYGPEYVATGGLGDVYISKQETSVSSGGVVRLKVGSDGSEISEEIFTGSVFEATRALAVDPVTGTVYVSDGSEIAEYNSAGSLQLTFGSTEPLGGSFGKVEGANAIAVNGVTDRVYVANGLHDDIDEFGPVVGPPVFAEAQPAVSGVARTSVLLAGSVDPESEAANYHFEYVAAGEYQPGAAEPYRDGGRTAITALAGGHVPEGVERVALSGLRPGTAYHYRMVVTNANATAYGPDETFSTLPATPPLLSTGPAVRVGETSAMLTGVVDPQGLPTSYVFEVGLDTSYGGARLYGNAGSSTGEVPVSVAVQYLVPGVTYHYRLSATSFDGSTYGQDGTFTTPPVGSSIEQPQASTLIASPAVRFPSVAGAVTRPVGASKPRRASSGTRGGLAGALRACRKHRAGNRRVMSCEARARRKARRAGKTNDSRKR
jgi:hypothetical protein